MQAVVFLTKYGSTELMKEREIPLSFTSLSFFGWVICPINTAKLPTVPMGTKLRLDPDMSSFLCEFFLTPSHSRVHSLCIPWTLHALTMEFTMKNSLSRRHFLVAAGAGAFPLTARPLA